MFGTAKALNRAGVLGINRRNAEFTLMLNKRSLYPRVDDKRLTKQLALAAGISVPQLYAVAESTGQVARLGEQLTDRRGFVVKPSHGSGGEGIVVVVGKSGSRYRTAGGGLLSYEDFSQHVYKVINGLYSLGGQRDSALVEYRVEIDPLFNEISFQGVPDIRVIVLYGVPVMSMVRLPTRMSSGRANLHQGAIGAGVDLATGRTLNAVWRNEVVDEHPDTGNRVSGLVIPQWDHLLSLSSRLAGITGLAYQGVDLVIDRDHGPMVLEINARPGLNIQIANRAGLIPRLHKVMAQAMGLGSWEEKVAFAKEHFAAAV